MTADASLSAAPLESVTLRPIVDAIVGDMPAVVAVPTLLRLAASSMRAEHGVESVNFHHATAEILSRAADSAQEHIPAWESGPRYVTHGYTDPAGVSHGDREKLHDLIAHHYGPQIASAAAFLGITG